MSEPTFLSRGIDYLGDLGAKLSDLRGYRTLAYELIQNADDATGATWMSFDVRGDALVVDNDGVFSDCRHIEQPECPWKTDQSRQHRCDFHRFRLIASGDKRGEAGTTGAFGIGFIAVYQITDRPELISGGRHWIINEENDPDERIEVCAGCCECAIQDLPGTRFVLPWAFDAHSTFRKALRAEPVMPDGPQELARELEDSLPLAMLFLKKLRTIEMRREGRTIHRFKLREQGESRTLSDGGPNRDRVWHMIFGDFSESAGQLQDRHPDLIESKRSPVVTLAIPVNAQEGGLLYACLPTEQNEGLPFHVNADFFPTNDRKRVILGHGYQSEWNREALRCSAKALLGSVDKLPALLGAQHFWELISTLKEVNDAVEKDGRESTLASFWKAVVTRLRSAPVVYTTRGGWATPADTSLLLQQEEVGAIPVLESLGVKIVNEDLRPYQSLLRSDAVGVPVLNIERLCAALVSQGMDRRVDLNALPDCLTTESGLEFLWEEILRLLAREQRTPKARADDEQRLRKVAIAPGRDKALWPCGEIYWADDATVALFEPLDLNVPFVSRSAGFASLLGLCRPFNVASAIDALQRAGADALERLWREKRLPLGKLFEWFENRRQQLFENQENRQKLASLAIFPTSENLRMLDEVSLPGNFDDPLGLAEIIDLTGLARYRDLFRDLGMRELNFRTYAVVSLPRALNEPTVSVEKRRAAVLLLAGRFGELRDDRMARQVLAATALVECADGQFRQASDCYFSASSVQDCFGGSAHVAVLPLGHEDAVRALYAWLGVAGEPRLKDLVTMVQRLTSNPHSSPAARQIQHIVAYLGKRVEANDDPQELNALRGMRWLPARGKSDRWYSPAELYAAYQDFLFESQALFLDVPKPVQTASQPLLKFLRIQLTPPVPLVVKHLLHCAMHRMPPNVEIYRFLNDKASDPEISRLRNENCLWLCGGYRAPNQVFWGDHPFGRYRWRLGDELRAFNNLFSRLGVRETPDFHDALSLLKEISTEFGRANQSLDEEAYAVLMKCWQVLERAIGEDATLKVQLEALRSKKCVPNVERILNPPEWMFFENRVGLAAKFGAFIAKNVISRPLGAGDALAAAGVRPLGSAVKLELLECRNPTDYPEMTQRMRARRNEIGRALASQISGPQVVNALARLDNIRCHAVSSLMLRYRLRAFNREVCSEPEQVPAVYQPEEEVLLFSRDEVHSPWPAIARELATALYPDEDPGRFAPGIKEVLAAESATDAAIMLDELGLAQLDTTVRETPVITQIVGALGTSEPLVEAAPALNSMVGITQEPPVVLDSHEAVKRLLGPDVPPPTPPPEGSVTEPLHAGLRMGTGEPTGSAQRKGRPVLRSYLPSPNSAESDANKLDERKDGPGRSPVDQAGVRRVMDFELSAGRSPTEMPHNHPGYDVESRDLTKRIVRYIEVKSFSGDWRDTYAVLSRPQFDKALELGELYWLYVVERAETEEPQLCRIQNPALRANHFMFDDGWHGTAEGEESTQEG